MFDRRNPPADNELLKSVPDLGAWLLAAGLVQQDEADAVARITDGHFLEDVRDIREASYALFEAIASRRQPSSRPLAFLYASAATGLETEMGKWQGAHFDLAADQWADPPLVKAFLAQLSIEAFFTLPRQRLHACPRCGWLFVDTSRGGKRRWCNMRICGNREKVSRHRGHA